MPKEVRASHPFVMLIVLDGFGINPKREGNAIALAKKQTFTMLEKGNRSQLMASGESVGLPNGQMGNSEVGHMNMGAGRIVCQDFVRINQNIKEGRLIKNPVLQEAFAAVKKNKSKLHVMGLVSDGGIHSHIDHLMSLLKCARQEEVSHVYVHCFLDGRDTPYNSSPLYIKRLDDFLKKESAGKIATLSGRYYAMDRDKRWDRIQKTYDALTEGKGFKSTSALLAIHEANRRGETDEFVCPTVLNSDGLIEDRDVVIYVNFRADRARQLTLAFTQNDFSEFTRAQVPKLDRFLTMTRYHKNFLLPVIFPAIHLTNVLGEILANHHIAQLRIAETEKYAHVTFFFNGGEEKVFPGEERILIPSAREVATYDLKPQMNAPEITQTVIRNIEKGTFGFILLNFANADMVGHSGNLPAAIKAVETLDKCLGKIIPVVQKKNGHLLITSDHGNVEQMIDPETGEPHTAHTTNPVPFYYLSPEQKRVKLQDGILSDITPTILTLMGLDWPKEITRKNLVMCY